MSRILCDFFDSEYDKFVKHLSSEWAIGSGRIKTHESTIKSIHRAFLGIACAATVTGYRAKRNEYAAGITETSFLGVVFAVKGLENPSAILLRQSIELCMKHIYFANHPIEYDWCAERDAYRELNFQALLEYLTKTDECRRFAEAKRTLDAITASYAELSRYVHVQNKRFLKYNKVCRACVTSRDLIEKVSRQSSNLWPHLITLLIIFFRERYARASVIEKRLITYGLTKDLHRQVKAFLASL